MIKKYPHAKIEQYLYWLIFAVVICIGLYLRLYKLGSFGFWAVELFHTIPAQFILTEGAPYLPLRELYYRAFPITYITAFMFKYFGASEVSARIPHVCMNLTFLVAAFLVLRKWLNKNVALLFLVVLALSPFEISMARECRMYSFFQFFFFFLVYFFIRGFEYEKANKLKLHFERVLKINTKYLLLSSLFFALSFSLQTLTVNFGLVVLVYACALFIYLVWKEGFISALKSKYAILIGSALLIFIPAFFLKHETVMKIVLMARELPPWAMYQKNQFFLYRYYLSESYPLLFFIYPLSISFLVKEKGRKGFFIATVFIFLILFHSFIFARKELRYIFYIFPFFVIGASYLTEKIIRFVFAETQKYITRSNAFFSLIFILLLLPAFYAVGYPWMARAFNISNIYMQPNWKSLPEDLKRALNNSTVITTNYKDYLYYFGQLPEWYIEIAPEFDYIVRKGEGIDVIYDMDTFLRVFNTSEKDVYIIASKGHFYNDAYLTQEMREYIFKNAELYPHSGDPAVIIYKKKN
jgi:hypothetical protein